MVHEMSQSPLTPTGSSEPGEGARSTSGTSPGGDGEAAPSSPSIGPVLLERPRPLPHRAAAREVGAAPTPKALPPAPARKGDDGRDAFFDNAKYLAIVLVAMGHAWEPLRGTSRTAEGLYDFVFAFHMPAFIIISGYFSRSFDLSPKRLQRLLTGVAVPYLVFETAYSLFKRTAGHSPGFPISLLDPWYLTWFLAALFIWRLTTPLWRVVRWPLPISLVIAALATTEPHMSAAFDLQRLLQFLPYFVLGLSLRPKHFAMLRRTWVRVLAVPVLAGGFWLAYWAGPQINDSWFYHRDAAGDLGAPWWIGPVSTFALFSISLVLTGAFFALVPGRRTWFTALGAGTLYGYLLHGFLIKGADFWGWYDRYAWIRTPGGLFGVTVIAGVVVTALCSAPVRRVFRFAVEPRMAWAFRAPEPAKTG
jgi:fucose 4-O-acetylase-like acetyltransferase